MDNDSNTLKPKSYQEILKDLVKALEGGMYSKDMSDRGIKWRFYHSWHKMVYPNRLAPPESPPLIIEGLIETMRSVSFDMKHIIDWKNVVNETNDEDK